MTDQRERPWRPSSYRSFRGELPLHELVGGDLLSAYRFTWDCDTDCLSYMVRLDVLASGRASIVAKNGRYFAPDLHGTCVPLPQADLLMFRLGLEDMQFWSLPPKIQLMGLDGALWTLEGLDAGRYHAIERWSPCDKLWKLGRMMLRMGGIDVSQITC